MREGAGGGEREQESVSKTEKYYPMFRFGKRAACVALLCALLVSAFPPVAVCRGEEAPAGAAETGRATLTVTFDNVRSTRGVIRALLFDADRGAKGFPGAVKHARERRVVTLAPGETPTLTFAGLAPGTYAVSAYHDENNNDRMDMTWYGKPTEGSAVSNNPRPRMRAPRFEEARFEVPAGGKAISLRLWYP